MLNSDAREIPVLPETRLSQSINRIVDIADTFRHRAAAIGVPYLDSRDEETIWRLTPDGNENAAERIYLSDEDPDRIDFASESMPNMKVMGYSFNDGERKVPQFKLAGTYNKAKKVAKIELVRKMWAEGRIESESFILVEGDVSRLDELKVRSNKGQDRKSNLETVVNLLENFSRRWNSDYLNSDQFAQDLASMAKHPDDDGPDFDSDVEGYLFD